MEKYINSVLKNSTNDTSENIKANGYMCCFQVR